MMVTNDDDDDDDDGDGDDDDDDDDALFYSIPKQTNHYTCCSVN